MRKDYPNQAGKPPVWAEALLRALLTERSRDAIAGDLLEEYRDSVLPAVGTFRATIWYVRQVLSFLDPASLVKAVRRIPAPFLWGTAAALVVYLLVFALPYATGMDVSTVLLLFTGIVLTLVGATAIRSLPDGLSLLQTGIAGFICFGVATALVSSAQVFRPALIMGTFLIVVTATGFRCAFRTGQIRSGIVAAVGTGTAATALLVGTVTVLHHQHPPFTSILVLPAAAAFSGAIGALFGKRFGCPDADILIPGTNFV
jgi:hypothetical protein